jgi:tryptophan synthase beta subunit
MKLKRKKITEVKKGKKKMKNTVGTGKAQWFASQGKVIYLICSMHNCNDQTQHLKTFAWPSRNKLHSSVTAFSTLI